MTSPRPNGIELCVTSFNMKPEWKAVVSTDGHTKSTLPGDETNLEQWQNLQQAINVDALIPRKAIPISARSHDYYYSGSYTGQEMCTHAPWYLAIQRHWPNYFGSKPILFYDLVKSPTSRKPYYEAFVCCMPNIRCKAKTIELLEEQLLQHYASYLETLLEESIPEPGRKSEVIFGESWIAKQPARSEIKADMRILSPSSQIDYTKLPWVQFGY